MHPQCTMSPECPSCTELRATIAHLQQQLLDLRHARRLARRRARRTPQQQRSAVQRWVACACGCGHLAIAFNDQPAPCLFNHRKSPPTSLPYIVSADGCWLWRRGLSGSGYGQFTRGNTTYQAHRAYYEYTYGPLPEGVVLDHLCCVRSCVNPDHVEPVTVSVNTRRGKTTKLTAEQVIAIRALGDAGAADPNSLAKHFGVSATNIRRILARKTWTDIPDNLGATGD